MQNQISKNVIEEDSGFRCPLSRPDQPHTLSYRREPHLDNLSQCFNCGKQNSHSDHETLQFYCTVCDVVLHSSCRMLPKKIRHPYHLQHPLTLTSTYHFHKEKSESFDIKCTWCRNHITESFYHCSICNFCLDLSCFENDPPLTITNPKSHQHSLFFFPRPFLLPCDACGSRYVLEPSYVCFQCNYMVHQTCIDLPRVIKITHHNHRLFHSPYLEPTMSSCGICYQNVDVKFGQYSCNIEHCSFVAHSKCATHEQIWDGRELEWEPEQLNDESKDFASFTKVSDDLIKYFCHEHLLRLQKYDIVRDLEKQCEACILHIDSNDFYHCLECDFYLHEICANLPLKLDHVLHKHPLFLHPPSPLEDLFDLTCLACSRPSNGFQYKCKDKDCRPPEKYPNFRYQIDVRCILGPEYFNHTIHNHPIFISTIYDKYIAAFCEGCKKKCYDSHLKCIHSECNFAMCYECATIPKEIQYKYDEHSRTLCYGEDTDEIFWCEICEKQGDSRKWFYTCNKCCVTIHTQCLFGSSSYMKSGSTFGCNPFKVQILRNNGTTRPICRECDDRCRGYVYYKWNEKFFCSLDCWN